MNRKKVGIILIVIGLILFVGLLSSLIIAAYHAWALNLDGFQYRYASFADLLYSREKGSFLISAILGLIPISLGTTLIQGGKHR